MSFYAYWGTKPETRNLLFTLYMLTVVVSSRFITIPLLNAAMRMISVAPFCPSSVRTLGYRTLKLPPQELHTLALGGLVRGCLCWAQVLQLEGLGANSMITTTLVIVLATTVSCGVLLPVLIDLPVPPPLPPPATRPHYLHQPLSHTTTTAPHASHKYNGKMESSETATLRSSFESAGSEVTLHSTLPPHVARRLVEMEQTGVSERFLSLPDVPGLCRTRDFRRWGGRRVASRVSSPPVMSLLLV